MSKSDFRYLLFALALCCAMVLIQSCSVEKRAQRHLKKALYLDPSIKKKDTLRVTDTLTTEEVRIDTILSISDFKDTIFINEDRLSIKLVRVLDSIYISGECDSDTIYYNKEIIVEKLIQKNYPKPLQRIIDYWYLFLIGALMFLYFLAKLLKK